jgi:hypothetical protein
MNTPLSVNIFDLLQAHTLRKETHVSAVENITLVRRLFEEAFNTGNLALADEALHPIDMTGVHVWMFRNGKAVRFEVYIETPQMLRVLEG